MAASLDSMTSPGEKIIDELYEHFKPLYNGFLESKDSRSAQLGLAKRAIFKAYECLLFYKRDNEGELPIVVLKNLLHEEPNAKSRHVTIAISGWLSQETEVSQQWADLVDYFKDSNSSLFAY